LVGSALSHLAKQPLLVRHLARHVGLLLLMCKEVLAVAATGKGEPAGWRPAGSLVLDSNSADATSAEHQARHDKLQQVRHDEPGGQQHDTCRISQNVQLNAAPKTVQQRATVEGGLSGGQQWRS